MKPCSKTRSGKSACANLFLELPLTIQFRHYLGMNANHAIDQTLTFIQWLLIIIYLLTLTILTQASGLQHTKNRLLHRCFPVNFEKLWRTPILKNIWTNASVYWLLHHILIFTVLGNCPREKLPSALILTLILNQTLNLTGGNFPDTDFYNFLQYVLHFYK